jgi:hypothetical protein
VNISGYCLRSSLEEFCEKPVTVRMAAYLHYRIQDGGDMHRSPCPPVLRDGNLISGLSIRTILFFGTGIVTAGCAAVMIACLIVISFLIYY